ncbi:Leucine-rich repeat [Sesbania bispinosa]|nr:Leucine-rich repeat [Sesbania bispinosa]
MIVHIKFLNLLAEFIAVLYLLLQGHVLCDEGFISSEAEALVNFKEGLKDPSNHLSTWARGTDCCQWKGVRCNTSTGHVISLDLYYANSFGELRSSLLELPYLSSLNLSGNDFMQSQVPAFLGNMKNLKHLDLSYANFKGNLPHNLGNLSQLESLDLSGSDNSLRVDNLKWLHGLPSLKNLDLSGVDLSSNGNDWFLDISMLPSLVTLRLSSCQLYLLPPSPPELNCDSLVTLDLSFNYFHNTIPYWLFENCHHLQHLNIRNNQLQGPIPDSIERLKSLVALDLSNNELTGSIPSTLGQIDSQNRAGTNTYLKELRLSNNQLNGSLERSLAQLSKLVVLDLVHNKLEGNISDAHLANLSSLKVLDLSFNRVTLNLSENWVPPFQLETIGLANCQLGPQFPKWIQRQKNFSVIDLSSAGISDAVPDWFWDLSPSIEYMNLSYNELRRCGHDFSQKFRLGTLDLSHNKFSCPLPHLPPNMRALNLATNSFHGTISHVCEMLGVNNSLGYLDLSSNNLSGIIPNCWTHGENMIILNLAHNQFYGSIPDSLGSLTSLHTLSLYHNDLSGKIPGTLKDCQMLTVLHLSYNRFWGPIPSWIGEEMRILKVLSLRANWFEGNIPTTLCQLKSLQVLDLSENQLRGAIPRCAFPAMATDESINELSYTEFQTIKGILSIYQSGMGSQFISVLDLSSNLLTEGIPVELGGLNLSSNQLVGSIPSEIGEMKNLESLDLSRNQLSCAIPTSLANLSFLAYLNLSHNTLSGEIPSGNQLLTFHESSYFGNPHLCGPPLTRTCPGNNSIEEDTHCNHIEENRGDGNHEDDKREGLLGISSFYISMGIGFFSGFWLFWGSLILITPWRYAYFRFLGNINDKIYVTIAIAHAKLRRKFQTQQPSQ